MHLGYTSAKQKIFKNFSFGIFAAKNGGYTPGGCTLGVIHQELQYLASKVLQNIPVPFLLCTQYFSCSIQSSFCCASSIFAGRPCGLYTRVLYTKISIKHFYTQKAAPGLNECKNRRFSKIIHLAFLQPKLGVIHQGVVHQEVIHQELQYLASKVLQNILCCCLKSLCFVYIAPGAVFQAICHL